MQVIDEEGMSDKQTAPEAAQDSAREAETAQPGPGSAEAPAETPEAETAPSGTPQASGDAPQAQLAQLEAELGALRDELGQANDQRLRTLAEMDNLRKRTARDLDSARKYALERFAMELLPVRDSLELGLAAAQGEAADVASLREGTELTLKLLTQALAKHGIVEVAPQGERFNPDLHQAMAMQPSADLEPDHVLTVHQKGYTLNDRLLRPALVIVSTAPPPPADAEGA